VLVCLAAVVLASLEAELGIGQVALDELLHRRICAGVATLIDLVPKRVSTFSASFSASGPAGTVSRRYMRVLEIGSIPA
jgi:hypothetical protein